jgi:hypothetical protein
MERVTIEVNPTLAKLIRSPWSYVMAMLRCTAYFVPLFVCGLAGDINAFRDWRFWSLLAVNCVVLTYYNWVSKPVEAQLCRGSTLDAPLSEGAERDAHRLGP